MKPSFYLYAFIAFLFVFGLVKAARAGGEDFTLPDKKIDCYANPQADLIGWKRVEAVDRYRIAVMASEGKAIMRHEHSLLCQNTEGGKVTAEYVIYEWWWKVKK